MKAKFKKASALFMLLAAFAAVTIGLNIMNIKSFSAKIINCFFPLDCRVEYIDSGETLASALVTLDGDSAVIKCGSLTHRAGIDSIILTDNIKSQRTQNSARTLLMFCLALISALMIPFSLTCIGMEYYIAYLACAENKFQKNHLQSNTKNTEKTSFSAVA